MRRFAFLTAILLASASALPAQITPQVTPRDSASPGSAIAPGIAREIAETYNAAETLRSLGPYVLDSGDVLRRDLAVVDGPVTIGGHVTGRVVAVNADVALLPGAQIDGGLLVVGGRVRGAELARIAGGVRVLAPKLAYREEGDQLIPAGVDADDMAGDDWWERWRARRQSRESHLLVVTGRTYDRVEGLPIMAGPTFRGRYGWGELRVDALGILRTADGARWDSDNVGHQARTELRLGRGRGVMVGGELYDVVRPVEEWHLGDAEVGLASAFLHRDYRDYFNSHGGALYAGLFAGADADVTLRYGAERWGSRAARDPLSLFRNGDEWRPNPLADDGSFHTANVTLRVDTRNVIDRPWSGWFVVADYEAGSGRVSRFAPLSPGVRSIADASPHYGRGLLDVRRYSRISPQAQVNLRGVLGGWLHGDPLPAQRRLSVGGIGTLPGFDFRTPIGAADVGQCDPVRAMDGGAAGTPAQCDRVILLQAEYRSDLHLTAGLDDVLGLGEHSFRRAQWVAFANAGRGWLVGDAPATAGVTERLWVRRGSLPGIDSFRADIGGGIDFGALGVYVAKAVTEPGQRANVYVRLRNRF